MLTTRQIALAIGFLKLVLQKKKSRPQGSRCTFVRVGDYGVKFYSNEEERDNTFLIQSKLSDKKLAPKCGQKINTQVFRSFYYGYVTEVVKVAVEKHAELLVKQGITFQDYDYGLLYEGFCKRSNTFSPFFQKIQKDNEKLTKKLRKKGFQTSDNHLGNFGWGEGGKPMVIDFTHADYKNKSQTIRT